MWWRSALFTALLFGTMAFLIPNLIGLVSWLVGKLFSIKINYAPFFLTGVSLMLLIWVFVAYGHLWGRFQTQVNEVEYTSNQVPAAFDGFKIVHISDLHVDSFDENPETLEQILTQVNEQHPDIILFTGDLTTADINGIHKHEKALKLLQAKEGVVSVLGNHDFFIYEYWDNRQRCAAADSLTAYEREQLGWKVLRNASFLLHRGTDSLAIAGVDNINGNQGFKTIQKGDLKAAMKGLENTFTILLTHDPSHWEAEVLPQSQAQITLSGHTHAAQVRLFGWAFSNLMFRESDGRYDHEGRMLYVNAGIGCTAPFRIFCPAEITVITLRH